MERVLNIKAYLRRKIHIFLTLFIVSLLSACGDEVTDCGTIQDNMNYDDVGGCLLCPLFDVLSNSASIMADISWNAYAPGLSSVVLVVAAIYIALSVLKMVGAFGKQNVADFLTSDKNGLFIFMFKVAIIYYLLAHGLDNILKYLITPLFASAVDIANKISPSSILDVNSALNINSVSAGSPSWKSLFNMLYDLTKKYSEEVSVIIAIGQTMVCTSTIGIILKWHFLMLIYGSLIFIFGWILLSGISFFLADLMIRILFAAVLLPLGIACAVSKLSISYTKNIWNLFLNVFFNLIILGILLNITLKLVLLCLGQNVDGTSGFAGGNQADLIEAINTNQIETVASIMQMFNYLLLTIVCFSVIFNLVRQMGALAENISDTVGFSPSSEAMAPFTKAAIGEAQKVGSWGKDVVGNATAQVGHDVARATRLDKLYKWSGDKATGMRGFMTGTGSQGYKAFWRPSNFSRSWIVRGGKPLWKGGKYVWRKMRGGRP